MNDKDDKPRKVHPGIRFGVIGGLFLGFLFLIQIFLKTNILDIPIILLSVPVYFLLGRSAANEQYESQRDSFDSMSSVQSSGMGAALTAVIFVWLSIIIRGLIRDALGQLVITEPLSLCLAFGASGGAAILMGTLGGRSVVKQYGTDDD